MAQLPNPHTPRNDKPGNEEQWTNTLQAKYTSATKVEPVLKMEKPAAKVNSYLGKI